ncbi:secretion apparatus protein BsaZ [Striga asiatica]|uniref:Secretion apparatus protein BsaZ n=1 Tax=Striga asiatica TaxID=4170 RepID=A0A5A7Q9R9_STRAF|nr:secretion apparatus protein BsaZ [Striga asiatica]
MPTFTSIALENLLEHGVRDTHKNPSHGNRDESDLVKAGPRHLYISPGLYATPDQAPIPDHPPSPSPYVVNLKRRRSGSAGTGGAPEFASGGEVDVLSLKEVREELVDEVLVGNDEAGEEDEGFLDRRSEAMSVGSETEANDFDTNQIDTRSLVSAQGEFFDAIEDFSTDSSVSNEVTCGSRFESELHAIRLNLLEEIEKRKIVEENLTLMRSQWERIRDLMSEAGLTFPAPPVAKDIIQLDNNLTHQISQEVVVSRFVAEAIGRSQAHAEAEEAALAVIEMKDQEISRLRDRLQYYETVNHEMSQRKLVEVARRQQERKTRRRRWLWSFMGLSITIGASFVAYSYFPQSAEIISLLKRANSTDASPASAPETSPQN